jgi:hypothetical protein
MISGFHRSVNEIFWDFTQRRLVACHPRFRTTHWSHLKAMGMTDCNSDDESMPNDPVAYTVQLMQMRKTPYEGLVWVLKSFIMLQISSKFFQAEQHNERL